MCILATRRASELRQTPTIQPFPWGHAQCTHCSSLVALPIVALSSEEVAHALCRLGFVVTARGASGHVLERNLRQVRLLPAASISPDALLAIVREAGVTYSELVEALGGETETEGSDPFPDPKHESHVRRRS